MATSTFSSIMNPIEWAPGQTNYVLGITGLVTSAYTFGASITITDNSLPPNTWNYNQSGITGFAGIPGSVITLNNVTLPITISGTITNNSNVSNQSTTNQHALGSKGNNGVPACYQVSNFVNDAGTDNDYNDLVMNFQLFCSSTD
jgi:hypothetical protein